MTLNSEQRYALRDLASALALATSTGLLDLLEPETRDPRSINDLCDAVQALGAEVGPCLCGRGECPECGGGK